MLKHLLLLVVSQGEPVPALELQRLASIGDLEGPRALSVIGSVVVDGAGRTYVAQPQDHAVKLLDASGGLLQTFGRSGAGPGEFRSVSQLFETSDGVMVQDVFLRRTVVFDADGSVQATVGAPRHLFGPSVVLEPPAARLADGRYVAGPALTPENRRLPIIVHTAGDPALDILGWITVNDAVRRVAAGGIAAVVQSPVRATSLWAVAPSGDFLVVVDLAIRPEGEFVPFRIAWIGPNGDSLRMRDYRVRPVRVPSGAFDDYVQRLAEASSRGRPWSPSQFAAVLRAGMDPPSIQAPVDTVVIGRDHRLWLRRGSFGLDTATWWALEPDGELLGYLRIPANYGIVAADGSSVWIREEGPMGEPRLTRYRWSRPPRSRPNRRSVCSRTSPPRDESVVTLSEQWMQLPPEPARMINGPGT